VLPRHRDGARTAVGGLAVSLDLEALEETIAILSDDEAVRQLAASDAELARAEGESEQDLAEAMRRRRKPA
jgi:antitoxin YefM